MTMTQGEIWVGSEWNHLDGKGCWYCPWEKPIVKLDFGAVCFSCLCRAFPGWEDAQVGDFLVEQVKLGEAWVKAHTKKALKDRFERDMAAVDDWLRT